MFNLLIVVSLVTLVRSHDITVGSDVAGSNKIFDEDRYASPAIWKQSQNVTINATNNEVISKVVVTDMRPEKDGEVKILEGGEGQNNVTLELKSPTALRGFAFHIEAYSAPKDKVKITSTTPKVEEPLHPAQTRQRRDPNADEANFKAPVSTFKGTTDSDESRTHPIATDTKINDENKKVNTNAEHVRPARDVISGKTTETKPINKPNTEENKTPKSETGADVPRLTRDAAKEINEKADEHKTLYPAAKDGQTVTHPISTFKQASSENPHQISTARSLTEESRNNDGKRAARDTETDEEESDDSEQTRKGGKGHEHDSHVPTTLSMENHTPPREFKRQVSQSTENNNSSAKTSNNGAYVPPLGFANAEPTNVKARVVRDTEERKVKSPSFVTSNDAKSTLPASHVPTTLSMENHTPPHEFKRQVSQPTENNNSSTKTTNNGAYVPPRGFANAEPTNVKARVVRDTEEKKANSPPFVTSNDAKSTLPAKSNTENQSFGRKNFPSSNGQTNTAIPIHLTPLPYATSSSTTEKTQNKRDTVPKLSGKEQQTPQVNVKNTPRPFNRQKPKETEKNNKPAHDHTKHTTH